MKRCAIAILASAGLLAGGAGAASAAPIPARYGQASLTACQPSVVKAERFLTVHAHMRAVRGTQQMAVRVDLFARTPKRPRYHRRNDARHRLWTWHKSAKVANFIYDLTIAELDAPARYRIRVGFRWYGAHHKVLGTRWRWLPVCAEPELRPDLAVRFTRRGNGYRVRIVNLGRTGAGPFQVTLGGVTRSLPGLAPHASAFAFRADACAGTVQVDPADAVDEANERNNARPVPCPGG